MHSEPMKVQIASFRLLTGSDVWCSSCAVRGVVIENGSGHRARFLSEACES